MVSHSGRRLTKSIPPYLEVNQHFLAFGSQPLRTTMHSRPIDDLRPNTARRLFYALYLALLIFPCLATAVGDAQDLYDGEQQNVIAEPPPLTRALGRLAFTVESILAASIVWLRAREGLWPNRGLSMSTRLLWFSLFGYWLVETVRGFAAYPALGFNLRFIIAALLFEAFFLCRDIKYSDFFRCVRTFVWTLTLVTFAVFLLAPSKVSYSGYIGYIPFVSFRLHGFSNANHTAYFLAFYLLLPRPVSAGGCGTTTRNCLLDAAVVFFVVLTQSKTIYLLFAATLAIKLILLLSYRVKPLVRSFFVFGLSVLTISSLLLAELIVGSGATSRLDGSFETLTGRTRIWDMMLTDWQESPWFGFGANTWQTEGMPNTRAGNWVVPHAHNQVVQTLWQSGIVGLAFLVLHAMAMLWCAFTSRPQMKPGLVALTLLLLGRCYTEIPIFIVRMELTAFIVHASLFLLFCGNVSFDDDNGFPQTDSTP